MTNAFGQRISDSMLPVMAEYERWIKDPAADKDVRPLAKAAALHLKTMGRVLPLSEVAPCFAIIYFSIVDFESGWMRTQFIKALCWLMRKYVFRGRPMWNDFYMVLWQLSRDDRYVHRLYTHLKHGSVMQVNTGAWMINSVCQQDEEFRTQWNRLVQTNGSVFGGPIAV